MKKATCIGVDEIVLPFHSNRFRLVFSPPVLTARHEGTDLIRQITLDRGRVPFASLELIWRPWAEASFGSDVPGSHIRSHEHFRRREKFLAASQSISRVVLSLSSDAARACSASSVSCSILSASRFHSSDSWFSIPWRNLTSRSN